MSKKVLAVLLAITLVVLYVFYEYGLPRLRMKPGKKEVKPVKSYVSVIDGNAKLLIEGKPVDILGFYATSEVKEYIDKAAKFNVTFCHVCMSWLSLDKVSRDFARKNRSLWLKLKNLSRSGRLKEAINLLPTFKLPDNAAELIDFNLLDNLFNYAARKGVKIIFSFHYLTPPVWWVKNFPDQLQANETGGLCYMASFSSPALFKYADQVIEALVKRYRNHPSLLGWGLSFGWTSEDNYPGSGYYASWGFYDYSLVAVRSFREWLKKRYKGDLEELRRAWGNLTVTFENALPPKPVPKPKDVTELVKLVNGPGDLRRAWLDWCEFRLEEKRRCMLHFARLYKELDPNHVLVQTPSSPLPLGLGNAVYLAVDPLSYVKSPVDLVYVSPGIKEDTARNIKLFGYPPFLKYFEQRGKAAFIKWEGRPGVDYDSHPELIVTVAKMARKTGTGLAIWGGHVPMPKTWEEQPEFTDNQIRLFIEAFRSTPEGKLNKSNAVIIWDPKLCFFVYYTHRPYKLLDTYGLWALIHLAGLDCDVLTVDEVKENSGVLSSYKLAILDNLFRMDENLTEVIVNYLRSGGWVFIIGKTGVYDWYGGKKFKHLKRILNVTSEITEVNITGYSWSFTRVDDPLLNGVKGKAGDVKSPLNLLSIPKFNYEAEGFSVLGRLDQDPGVATVLRKGRLVVWFPRLGLQLLDRKPKELQAVTRFLKNLYTLTSSIHDV